MVNPQSAVFRGRRGGGGIERKSSANAAERCEQRFVQVAIGGKYAAVLGESPAL